MSFAEAFWHSEISGKADGQFFRNELLKVGSFFRFHDGRFDFRGIGWHSGMLRDEVARRIRISLRLQGEPIGCPSLLWASLRVGSGASFLSRKSSLEVKVHKASASRHVVAYTFKGRIASFHVYLVVFARNAIKSGPSKGPKLPEKLNFRSPPSFLISSKHAIMWEGWSEKLYFLRAFFFLASLVNP